MDLNTEIINRLINGDITVEYNNHELWKGFKNFIKPRDAQQIKINFINAYHKYLKNEIDIKTLYELVEMPETYPLGSLALVFDIDITNTEYIPILVDFLRCYKCGEDLSMNYSLNKDKVVISTKYKNSKCNCPTVSEMNFKTSGEILFANYFYTETDDDFNINNLMGRIEESKFLEEKNR